MYYNSIKNFFSPIKLNPNKSEYNVYSSSERKKNSIEKNLELFPTNTIKRGKEDENIEQNKKRIDINQKIDDVISFLSQKEDTNKNIQSKTMMISSKEKFNLNKYMMESKKKTEYEKIKENEILKERNEYLKKIIKEMKSKKDEDNNDINNTENSFNYYFLLNKNKQLINENKNLKEEYNILKLEQKSNTNIDKIMDNKFEIITKMKSLKFSISNLLHLLSSSNITEPNKNHNNIYNIPNYNNNSLKTHTINKYDISYRINEFNPDINYAMNNSNSKDDNKNDDNIIFTEGGNLNLNNNNSLLNENDTENNDENNNLNDDSSENDQFEISLKQFEKIDNKNLNNLIFNYGMSKKSNTANVTKRQKLNKKMANLTEKRKAINNANSYTKDMINQKEMKKDFKKYFNDEKIMKNQGDNMSYNFLNFRNICLDKKMLFGNGKNISDMNDNNIPQNFKVNNPNLKSNKIKYDIFRTKNISQKTYKGSSHTKNFRKVNNKSSKKIFK